MCYQHRQIARANRKQPFRRHQCNSGQKLSAQASTFDEYK
jgi:hypothetical protein